MQPVSSNKCISSSIHFWYLWGMPYGFHAIGGLVVGISISNRLVLPASTEDLDMMLSNSFSSMKESLYLASCGTCTSCNITVFLIHGALVSNLILVVCLGVLLSYFSCSSCDFFFCFSPWCTSWLQYFQFQLGFILPNHSCSRNMQTLSYVVLGMGMHLAEFEY